MLWAYSQYGAGSWPISTQFLRYSAILYQLWESWLISVRSMEDHGLYYLWPSPWYFLSLLRSFGEIGHSSQWRCVYRFGVLFLAFACFLHSWWAPVLFSGAYSSITLSDSIDSCIKAFLKRRRTRRQFCNTKRMSSEHALDLFHIVEQMKLTFHDITTDFSRFHLTRPMGPCSIFHFTA